MVSHSCDVSHGFTGARSVRDVVPLADVSQLSGAVRGHAGVRREIPMYRDTTDVYTAPGLLQAGNNTPLSGHTAAKVDTEKEECLANTDRC